MLSPAPAPGGERGLPPGRPRSFSGSVSSIGTMGYGFRSMAARRALVGRMDIRFADHPSFQRAGAGMVGGALLFGAALHPVSPLAPLAGGILGIAAGAAIAYGRAAWRMAAAGAALVPLFAMAPAWPML